MRRCKAIWALKTSALIGILSTACVVAPSSMAQQGSSIQKLQDDAQSSPKAQQTPPSTKQTAPEKGEVEKIPAQTTTQRPLTEAEQQARARAAAAAKARAESEARARATAERKAAEDAAREAAADKREAEEEAERLDPLQEKIRRSERRAIFTPRSYTNDEPQDELSPTQLLILDLLSRDSRPTER